MITSEAFAGKRYAVLGLARSGRATVEALLASGARVVAWDESEETRRALIARHPGESRDPRTPNSEILDPGLRRGDASLEIADLLTLDLSTFDAVVVSPGVPLNTHPIAAAARAANVPVIGDIELFAQGRASLPPHKVVGITGTNGKSTTTALVHHILKTAGVPTTMGGNIGLPILAQEPLPVGGVYVLELSSYQIDLTHSLDCDVAVLLNITPDHLDRYGSFQAYEDSKFRLFDMQDPIGSLAVSGKPLPVNEAFAARIPNAHVSFALDFTDRQRNWPQLQGQHNHQNAACAIAVAEWLDIDEGLVERALCTFPGLPHRMERIATQSGVAFVNDSKATNPDSAAPALTAFDAVHWIVGGRAKSNDLGACAPYFGHVRAAYAIGESAPDFIAYLTPHMPVADCGTLEAAVRMAATAAGPGDVVLLSPAAASFDQFRDFEARGEAFRAAVEALE